MTTIVVTKDRTGKLTGAGEKDKKAYARFKKTMEEMEPGEIFTLEIWLPREGWKHRKHFAMLSALHDAQEQFQHSEHLRAWLTVGAGHVVWVPGPNGKPVAIPDSIKYSRMDDVQFEEYDQRVKDFMRSELAQRFLWPHLRPDETAEIVEGVLREFEREQT